MRELYMEHSPVRRRPRRAVLELLAMGNNVGARWREAMIAQRIDVSGFS
jgi:hypothetical protein